MDEIDHEVRSTQQTLHVVKRYILYESGVQSRINPCCVTATCFVFTRECFWMSDTVGSRAIDSVIGRRNLLSLVVGIRILQH